MLKPPASYQPIRTPGRKLTATPTPMGMSGFRFQMEEDKVGGAAACSSYALYIYGLILPTTRLMIFPGGSWARSSVGVLDMP